MFDSKEMTIMNSRYLKISFIALALLFAQGCSFYARFGFQQQMPQGMARMAQNMTEQEKAQSN